MEKSDEEFMKQKIQKVMRWIVSVEIIAHSEHTNGIEDLDHTDSIKPV